MNAACSSPSAFLPPVPPTSNDHGALLIQDLWSSFTDYILDPRHQQTMKVLATHEKTKKKKYLVPCLAQQCHFTPFIMSADDLGCEADVVVCQSALKYASKTDKPYSMICGFMCNCISILSPWLSYSIWLHEFHLTSLTEWCRL